MSQGASLEPLHWVEQRAFNPSPVQMMHSTLSTIHRSAGGCSQPQAGPHTMFAAVQVLQHILWPCHLFSAVAPSSSVDWGLQASPPFK